MATESSIIFRIMTTPFLSLEQYYCLGYHRLICKLFGLYHKVYHVQTYFAHFIFRFENKTVIMFFHLLINSIFPHQNSYHPLPIYFLYVPHIIFEQLVQYYCITFTLKSLCLRLSPIFVVTTLASELSITTVLLISRVFRR